MRPECRRPQEAHQDAGGKEDADLHPLIPPIGRPRRRMFAICGPARGEGVAQHTQTRQTRHDAGAQREASQDQPLIDRARIARAGDAEGRRAKMAEDQHPVQHRVAGNAEEQHRHHRDAYATVRRRGCAAPQSREKRAHPSRARANSARSQSRVRHRSPAIRAGDPNSSARRQRAAPIARRVRGRRRAIRPAARRSPAPSACAASGATAKRIPWSMTPMVK